MKQIKGHKEGQQGQSESQAHEKGDGSVMDLAIARAFVCFRTDASKL